MQKYFYCSCGCCFCCKLISKNLWDVVWSSFHGTARPHVRFAWSPPSSWATGPDVGDSVWAKHWLRSPHAPLMCTHLCHLYLSHTHTLWHSSTLEPTHTLSLSLSFAVLPFLRYISCTHTQVLLALALFTHKYPHSFRHALSLSHSHCEGNKR